MLIHCHWYQYHAHALPYSCFPPVHIWNFFYKPNNVIAPTCLEQTITFISTEYCLKNILPRYYVQWPSCESPCNGLLHLERNTTISDFPYRNVSTWTTIMTLKIGVREATNMGVHTAVTSRWITNVLHAILSVIIQLQPSSQKLYSSFPCSTGKAEANTSFHWNNLQYYLAPWLNLTYDSRCLWTFGILSINSIVSCKKLISLGMYINWHKILHTLCNEYVKLKSKSMWTRAHLPFGN